MTSVMTSVEPTVPVRPNEEVAEYKFGSLPGVFGHLEYAKAAK